MKVKQSLSLVAIAILLVGFVTCSEPGLDPNNQVDGIRIVKGAGVSDGQFRTARDNIKDSWNDTYIHSSIREALKDNLKEIQIVLTVANQADLYDYTMFGAKYIVSVPHDDPVNGLANIADQLLLSQIQSKDMVRLAAVPKYKRG
ncbi:MAG: hypothetical protein FWD28_09060 [Treponema sp.]|nr:hypothetical protein [Treponema sp.]